MKKFSVLVILTTLGLFYALACSQQDNWIEKHERSMAAMSSFDLDQEIRKSNCSGYKNFNITFIQDTKQNEIYEDFHDEFKSQVSGKDHRYLNRGITCPEPCGKKLIFTDQIEIVNNTKNPLNQFSGS